MVAKELWSVARDKKSLPVMKISYLDRVSSLESKNVWLLRSYGRLLGTKKSLPVVKISYLDRRNGSLRNVQGTKCQGCEMSWGEM